MERSSSLLSHPLPNSSLAAGLLCGTAFSSLLAGVDRVPNCLWHLANDRKFWTGLKRENLILGHEIGFHGHETFSSKVREKAFCLYLTPTVGLTVSLDGPGEFWGLCRGQEKREDTQREREPGRGEQKPMNKNAKRCEYVWGRGCHTAIGIPWDHTVNPVL